MRFLSAIFRFSSLVELDDLVTDFYTASDNKGSYEREIHNPDKEVASDLSILTFVVGLAVSIEILKSGLGFFGVDILGPHDGQDHVHDQMMVNGFVGRFVFDCIDVDGVENEFSIKKEVFVFLDEVGGLHGLSFSASEILVNAHRDVTDLFDESHWSIDEVVVFIGDVSWAMDSAFS